MSLHRSLYLSCLAFAALSARAQTVPPDPSAGKIHLTDLIITASPLARAPDEIAAPAGVLAGEALSRRLQATLGETLAGQPGVDSTYFGPGASRPIIRGLGGDRIRVLTGGVGTIDASIVSPDHAVSLEPLLIERVEIVRGPAALLYGGGAIGGVVNVIDGRLPETLPDGALTGRIEVRGDTAAHEQAGAGVLAGAAGRWAWHLDGFRRETDDVSIPGLGPTPERAEEMMAAGEMPSDGMLINSATRTSGAAFGTSYVGKNGHLGVAYSGFDTRYGVVAEPEVSIALRQRRYDVHGEWLQPVGWLRAAKLQLGVADYRHDELEGAELGTRFKNKGYEGRLELLHEPVGPFEGALGLQDSASDFEAIGEEAFLPPTRTRSTALFLYEEAARGPLTVQLGARVEQNRITPAAGLGLDGRRHTPATFTAGTVWRLAEGWSLAVSLATTERAPNAQELFADGPHAGTGVYEVGDPALRPEQATGVDLSLRKRRGFVTGELSLFRNAFDGYIFEEATGGEEDGLPVFAFVQRGARLQGGEAEVIFHLHEAKAAVADLRVFADTVSATNTTTGSPLPRTTPVRYGIAFDWLAGAWSGEAEWRRVERQDRLAAGETATAGYDLLGLTLAWRFDAGRIKRELFLRGSNLLDETARVHASYLKDLAPLPGRNISAGVRVTF